MRNRQDWTEETAKEAEEAVGYAFSDRQLLLTAFTHKSYSNEFGGKDNERLEFLGDAVLELIVSDFLFRTCEGEEGKLTDLRKSYVSRPALDAAEKKAELMRFLRYSGGEENIRGKTPSNLFEAVVGAIYLDGGIGQAKAFLAKHLTFTKIADHVSQLQEHVQAKSGKLPEYCERAETDGYTFTVSALGKSAQGHGGSKQEAKQNAARALYEKLKEIDP